MSLRSMACGLMVMIGSVTVQGVLAPAYADVFTLDCGTDFIRVDTSAGTVLRWVPGRSSSDSTPLPATITADQVIWTTTYTNGVVSQDVLDRNNGDWSETGMSLRVCKKSSPVM
jgi:hypothetical protein